MSAPAIVVMGVTGAGKTTVGKAVAEQLGWRFRDSDEFHSAANKAKMRSGRPLDDHDRAPWLAALHSALVDACTAEQPLVLACSALKASYRRQLAQGLSGVRFVYLHGSQATLRHRLAHRTGHFMDPSLLDSQLEDLEEPTPDEALWVELDQPAETAAAQVAAWAADRT